MNHDWIAKIMYSPDITFFLPVFLAGRNVFYINSDQNNILPCLFSPYIIYIILILKTIFFHHQAKFLIL